MRASGRSGGRRRERAKRFVVIRRAVERARGEDAGGGAGDVRGGEGGCGASRGGGWGVGGEGGGRGGVGEVGRGGVGMTVAAENGVVAIAQSEGGEGGGGAVEGVVARARQAFRARGVFGTRASARLAEGACAGRRARVPEAVSVGPPAEKARRRVRRVERGVPPALAGGTERGRGVVAAEREGAARTAEGRLRLGGRGRPFEDRRRVAAHPASLMADKTGRFFIRARESAVARCELANRGSPGFRMWTKRRFLTRRL
jgi:hypothetical protein